MRTLRACKDKFRKYSELGQTLKMEPIGDFVDGANIVSTFKLLTVFAKSSMLDFWLGCDLMSFDIWSLHLGEHNVQVKSCLEQTWICDFQKGKRC